MRNATFYNTSRHIYALQVIQIFLCSSTSLFGSPQEFEFFNLIVLSFLRKRPASVIVTIDFAKNKVHLIQEPRAGGHPGGHIYYDGPRFKS